MQAGQAANGCWLGLNSPLVAEIIAGAGYDCVMIDLEHGPGSVTDAIALMQAVKGYDCPAFARVPENNPVWLKRILDAGVDGVMIPSVNSAEEASAAVAACRYAPKGNRGMAAPVVRASGFGKDWRGYVRDIEAHLLIMCQIESPQAVDEAARIVETEGLDMLFIGPFDLSAAMGHLGEPDHPEVRDAIGHIEDAAKGAGKLLGTIPTPERSAAALFDAGYHLILGDADVGLVRAAAAQGVAALRRAAAGS